MNRIQTLLFVLCLSIGNYAEALLVKSIDELKTDLSARTNPRVDENDQPCGLVRINVPTRDKLTFGDMIVGDVTERPGEYILYLSPATKQLTYTCKGGNNTITFADYDVVIEGKNTYRIILKDGDSSPVSSTSAYISANYDNQIVLVDGIPMGETPVLIESIEPGVHTIAVPNMHGYTMRDTTVRIKKGIKNEIPLILFREKPKHIDIEKTFGADTSGNDLHWGYNKFESNGKKGIRDYTGEIVVPCEFDYVSPKPQPFGYFIVGTKKKDLPNKYTDYHFSIGLYDPINNRLAVPTKYDDVHVLDYGNGEGCIRVYLKQRIGIRDCNLCGIYDIDRQCEIIPTKYEGLIPLTDGRFYFQKPNGYEKSIRGILDSKGIEYPDPLENSNYDIWWWHQSGANGMIQIETDGAKGFINNKFQLIIPPNNKLSTDTDFKDGIAVAFDSRDEGEGYCMIDTKGNIVKKAKPTLPDGFNFSNEQSIIHRNHLNAVRDRSGLFKIIDNTGLYERTEENQDHQKEGEYNFSLRYGYMDKDGNLLANVVYGYDNVPEYDEDGDWSYESLIMDVPVCEGLGIINVGDRYGFIDHTGKFVVPLIYTAVTPFENGVAFVRDQEGKWHKIFRKDLK